MGQRCHASPDCCDRGIFFSSGPEIRTGISALIRPVVGNLDHIGIADLPAVVAAVIMVITFPDGDRISDDKCPGTPYIDCLVIREGLRLYAGGNAAIHILYDLRLFHEDRILLRIRKMVKGDGSGVLAHGISIVILPPAGGAVLTIRNPCSQHLRCHGDLQFDCAAFRGFDLLAVCHDLDIQKQGLIHDLVFFQCILDLTLPLLEGTLVRANLCDDQFCPIRYERCLVICDIYLILAFFDSQCSGPGQDFLRHFVR